MAVVCLVFEEAYLASFSFLLVFFFFSDIKSIWGKKEGVGWEEQKEKRFSLQPHPLLGA